MQQKTWESFTSEPIHCLRLTQLEVTCCCQNHPDNLTRCRKDKTFHPRAEISQDCTSNTFWMPPSLPMSGYQFSRGKICRQKKFEAQFAAEKRWGPICSEAHTPLWQGRRVSEIHFLRGDGGFTDISSNRERRSNAPPVQWRQHSRSRIWYLSIFYKLDIWHKSRHKYK